MKPHVERMHNELKELQIKIKALSHFMTTTTFIGLEMKERRMRDTQLYHMKGYRDSLVLLIGHYNDIG